jgi:hypothetical protein
VSPLRSRLPGLLVVGLLAVPASALAATPAQRAYQAGLAAYVYGYPPVLHRLSQVPFPVNTMVGAAALTTPAVRLVVLPNVDTAYSVAHMDLRAEPLVVHVPAIAGRYYVMELLDAYTNVFGYIGTRATGTAAGDYAIVAPGFDGALPAGMHEIHSPTPDAFLLARTLVRSPSDLPAVHDLMGQYALTPLSTIAAGGAPKQSIVLDKSPPRTPPVVPTGLAFYDALDQVLADDPPPAADRSFLKTLAPYGIAPGLKTSQAALPAAVRSALVRAATDGPKRIAALAAAGARSSQRKHAGWQLEPAATGAAGTDYDLRATVAKVGLWANTPAEAVYPQAGVDSALRTLTGAHRYVLHFAKSNPPPARAFWSLTMYNSALLLYANPLNRYALGDRSGLRRASDGGLTLYLQHTRPAGHVANWLPAPAGRFTVTLRLYEPSRAASAGRWAPPGIRRVG